MNQWVTKLIGTIVFTIEVNLEIFDEDDDIPPLGSTENLIRPMTKDDLLDQAVDLIAMGSQDWDDDEDDQLNIIVLWYNM